MRVAGAFERTFDMAVFPLSRTVLPSFEVHV